MKVATLPKKRRKDLIIIAILLIGLPVLVFASYQIYQLITRARAQAQPQNVVISNLTTSSVNISWVTDIPSEGSVIPILNNTELPPVIDKRGSSKRNTHYVELTILEPNTQYEFVIVSDSNKYTGQDLENFTFKTASISADTPTPDPIHGSVSGASGDDVVIYAMLKDKSAYPISAIMPRGGNWIMDISSLRSISTNSLVRVSDTTNMVLVAVSGINKGAVVEGTYSELFDSNGKLKDVYSLNTTSNDTLYTHFPTESILLVSTESVPDDDPSRDDDPIYDFPDYDTDDPDDQSPPTGSLTRSPSGDDDFPVGGDSDLLPFNDRVFRLANDLNWIDMVTPDGSVSAVTGEASVQITNHTDTGFTVVWVSELQEQGYIKYGITQDTLNLEANDERDGLSTRDSYYVHIVSVSRLQPETDYYFEIYSGDRTYDNGGSKFRVTTFSTLSSPPPFDSATGQVLGMPEHEEAIVVAQIKDEDGLGSQGQSTKIAALVNDDGRWIISIADARTEDGLSYFEYTSGDSLLVDIFTTFLANTHTESIEGISSKDIEITLGGSSTVRYTRIPLLDNYGLVGHSEGARLNTGGSDDSDTPYAVGAGEGQTPKTGIFDDFLPQLILSFGIVSMGVVLYIHSKKKPVRKNKMSKNI